MKLYRLRYAVVAAIVGLAMATPDVQAFWGSGGSWGSCGSSGGSYGSAGSHGSSGSHGSAGSHGSSGSHGSYGSRGSHGGGGLLARLFGGSHGSRGSHGSSGSHGSRGSHGSYGSHGSSGSHGSNGSHGSAGGVIIESAPMEAAPADPAPADATDSVYYRRSDGRVVARTQRYGRVAANANANLYVTVPEDATVYVNDTLTRSTGAERHFMSRNLTPGRQYNYRVRAEFERDGQTVTETKVAQVAAGSDARLSFTAPQNENAIAAQEETKTELTLHVPAEAKVFLAGAETRQSGAERYFATTKLAEGQTWDGYTIRVELERDGQTLVNEKTLNLASGDSRELSFDFDPVQVAMAN